MIKSNFQLNLTESIWIQQTVSWSMGLNNKTYNGFFPPLETILT